MRNFMEAYSAVHNTEAREELLSKRDEIAEMDIMAAVTKARQLGLFTPTYPTKDIAS